MSDPALGHVVEQTAVFARVSPAQKNRIIMALKHRSHVVGYLGDGINRRAFPRMRLTSVFQFPVRSMWPRMRRTSSCLTRSLDVLHEGIIEGRKAFR